MPTSTLSAFRVLAVADDVILIERDGKQHFLVCTSKNLRTHGGQSSFRRHLGAKRTPHTAGHASCLGGSGKRLLIWSTKVLFYMPDSLLGDSFLGYIIANHHSKAARGGMAIPL